jgi:hypothetical protein
VEVVEEQRGVAVGDLGDDLGRPRRFEVAETGSVSDWPR